MPVLGLHFGGELFPSLHWQMYLESKGCCFSHLKVMNFENFIILKVSKFGSHFIFKTTTSAEALQSGGPTKSLLSVFPYVDPCTAFLGIDLLVLSHFCMKSKDDKT